MFHSVRLEMFSHLKRVPIKVAQSALPEDLFQGAARRATTVGCISDLLVKQFALVINADDKRNQANV